MDDVQVYENLCASTGFFDERHRNTKVCLFDQRDRNTKVRQEQLVVLASARSVLNLW